MKTLATAILIFTLPIISQSRSLAQEVKWTTFENLNDSIRKAPKPILVFIHASWCKFCKMQDVNTFKNPEVAHKISSDYYALRLDGESKEQIKFLNRTYRFKASGPQTGTHELAEFLGKKNGSMTYPTTVFLSPQLEIAGKKTGFISAKNLLDIINSKF
ncbi:MAG: thioredoxin family protein [Cyclobacteriaceae bacterium]